MGMKDLFRQYASAESGLIQVDDAPGVAHDESHRRIWIAAICTIVEDYVNEFRKFKGETRVSIEHFYKLKSIREEASCEWVAQICDFVELSPRKLIGKLDAIDRENNYDNIEFSPDIEEQYNVKDKSRHAKKYLRFSRSA